MASVSRKTVCTSARAMARRLASRASNGSSRRTILDPTARELGQGDPLLLPARKLVRVSLGEAAETHCVQQVTHLRAALVGCKKLEADVRLDVEVWEEASLL